MHIQRMLRILVGLVFLYSSGSKLLTTTPQLTMPTIFSDWSQHPTIRFVTICGEAVIGLWMLSGIRPATASLLTIACVSGFSALLTVEIGKPIPKPCGCMGPSITLQSVHEVRAGLYLDLLRNAGLMAATGWIYLKPKGRKSSIQRERIRGGARADIQSVAKPLNLVVETIRRSPCN
jgi:hypothetical protein